MDIRVYIHTAASILHEERDTELLALHVEISSASTATAEGGGA